MKKYNVAILGATGAVGAEFLKLIEERNFPFNELRLLASKRSAGKIINFMGKDYTVQEATHDSFGKQRTILLPVLILPCLQAAVFPKSLPRAPLKQARW